MASRKLVGFLLSFGLAATLVQGCAKQGEGERCDLKAAGNSDCESGLVCVESRDLADRSTDRCCPPEDERYSDSRCARSGTVGTGGTSSAGAPATDGGAPAEGGAPATSGAGGA